jgi:hypothetical protein
MAVGNKLEGIQAFVVVYAGKPKCKSDETD